MSTSRAKTEIRHARRFDAIFTGLIRSLGAVSSVERRGGGIRLTVDAPAWGAQPATGDSIAVSGVCLTVAALHGSALAFDVIPETLARSNLGDLAAGDAVNLESSLRMGESLDGHFVYGHIDATAIILRIDPEGQGVRMWCAMPPALAPLVCEKGYVALDGISLTVAAVEEGRFAVALIPETLARTTLSRKGPGDTLNFEADPIARYVANAVKGDLRRQ